MKWHNEPQQWQKQNNKVTVHAETKTDFWRITRHNFITDNGHFYFEKTTENFIATVKVSGQYNALYDQAGLMVRLDKKNWIKCGIELVEGIQYASVVVTRDYSDWSVVALPENPSSIWFRLSRYESSIEIDFLEDGKDFHMLRQTYFTENPSLYIGLMCCAPQGNGFTVTFEDFLIRSI